MNLGNNIRQATSIVATRKLEDKALKCLTIAQRLLPGSSDEMIEEQAVDFMYMTEDGIRTTLQRMSSMAIKPLPDMDQKKSHPDDKPPKSRFDLLKDAEELNV